MPNANDIESQYKQFLGRSARPDELSFFQELFNSGDLKPYELGQFLQGLPEAQEARLPGQTQRFGEALGGQDTAILGRAADVARSQAVRLGRPDTSMIGSQIASAGQNLAMSRQGAIAQFYGQGIGQVNNSYLGGSDIALSRAYGLGDERRQFERDKSLAESNYNRQQNDFNNYLNSQRRHSRSQGAGGLLGAGIGAGLGWAASGGNPYGGFLGASVGGKLGGIF